MANCPEVFAIEEGMAGLEVRRWRGHEGFNLRPLLLLAPWLLLLSVSGRFLVVVHGVARGGGGWGC